MSETIFSNWELFKSDAKWFLFHLKSSFGSWIFVMQKNHFIRKLTLISKFMTSQSEKQTFAIHILPKMSWSKGNQTLKFGQSIGRTWEIFFCKNDALNEVEELFPERFRKNRTWAYLQNNSFKFCTVCFYCVQIWGYQNILIPSWS